MIIYYKHDIMKRYQNMNLQFQTTSSSKDRPTRADLQYEIDDTFNIRHGTGVIDAICNFHEKANQILSISFRNHYRSEGMGPYNLPTILKYHSNKYEAIRQEIVKKNR